MSLLGGSAWKGEGAGGRDEAFLRSQAYFFPATLNLALAFNSCQNSKLFDS